MSEHVKLVIERLPFYRLPVPILLALAMIFMCEKEQAKFASRFTGIDADDLHSPEVQLELHKKVKAELSDYAWLYLTIPADDLIEDIFLRIKTLAENNRFYKTTLTSSVDTKNQPRELPLLPSNWKRQLIAFLLPVVIMDKRTHAPGIKIK